MRRLFLNDVNIFVILCKEENMGNFQEQIFQEMLKQFPSILKYEVATVYVRQKIYKFGKNQLSSLKIQKAEFGNFTVQSK